MNAGLGVERLGGAAAAVEPGGRPEVALRVDRHAIGTAAWVEVIVDTHVAHRAVSSKVVGADHARAAFRTHGLDKVQSAVVRGDYDSVRPLDVGRSEDA